MQTFPECAATEEPMGAQFDPPGFATEIRRFAESKEGAFSRFSREAGKFHEKMAKKYGVNTEAGRVHYKASRAYREAATRLQEFFENGGEVNELNPDAVIRANKDAVAFHKKAAERAGLDSDQGHAHVAALEHHLDIINKAKKGKEAKFGHKGKEVPLPVPKKSEQPSGDIRQKKPLMKLQSPEAKKKENGYLAPRYEKSHQSEGGPGSGPRKGKKAGGKELGREQKIKAHVEEIGRLKWELHDTDRERDPDTYDNIKEELDEMKSNMAELIKGRSRSGRESRIDSFPRRSLRRS